MMYPNANYTGFPQGYDPWSMIQQALQMQQPGTPAPMPQMTPASMPSYGPMHSALADAFAQSLQRQAAYPGLLSQPTAAQMGLLSTAMTPATAVNMPTNGTAPALGPNEYFRLSQAFWNAMPNSLNGGHGNGGNGNGGNNSWTDERGRNNRPYSGNGSGVGNGGGGGGGWSIGPNDRVYGGGMSNPSTGESGTYGGGTDTGGIF